MQRARATLTRRVYISSPRDEYLDVRRNQLKWAIVGVTYHSMDPGLTSGNGAVVSIAADATFSGTGNYDNTGDLVPDAAATWTSVDCATITLP